MVVAHGSVHTSIATLFPSAQLHIKRRDGKKRGAESWQKGHENQSWAVLRGLGIAAQRRGGGEAATVVA